MITDNTPDKNTPDEDEKEEIRRREQTPIRDGDARPDKFVDPDFPQSSDAKKSSSPVTSNRNADVDKTEDYKDAR